MLNILNHNSKLSKKNYNSLSAHLVSWYTIRDLVLLPRQETKAHAAETLQSSASFPHQDAIVYGREPICQDSGFSLHQRFLVVNRSHERRRSEPWRVDTQTRKHAARFFFSKEPINYEAASRKAVLLCLMLCAAREQRRHVRVGMRVAVSVETQIVGGGTLGSWWAGVNHEMITWIEQDRNYCHQKHLLLLHAKKMNVTDLHAGVHKCTKTPRKHKTQRHRVWPTREENVSTPKNRNRRTEVTFGSKPAMSDINF